MATLWPSTIWSIGGGDAVVDAVAGGSFSERRKRELASGFHE